MPAYNDNWPIDEDPEVLAILDEGIGEQEDDDTDEDEDL